jgi:hypothetical protein
MQFIPKSLDEIESEEKARKEKYLWPAGTKCRFEVLYGAEEKDGNYGPYFQTDVRVFKDANTWLDLRTFLGIDSKVFYQFCEATGLLDRRESGQVDTCDIEGKTGMCVLGVKRKKKTSGEGFFENNTIEEFIVPVKAEAPSSPETPVKKAKAPKPVDAELDDSIPF